MKKQDKKKALVFNKLTICMKCGIDVIANGESYYISSSKNGGSALLCTSCWKKTRMASQTPPSSEVQ